MPLGHDPMQVLQPDRNKLHLGPLLGQMVDAGFEGQQFIAQIACAFGEDDQRMALRECVVKRLQGRAACSGDGRGVCGWVVRFFVLPLVGAAALLQAGQLLALWGGVCFALHQHAVEHVLDDEAAHRGGQPVIGPSHGAGDGSKRWRQRGPQQQEVGVTGVIGKVDALARLGCTARPEAAHTGQGAGQCRQTESGQACSRAALLRGKTVG